jgi:hypothetical protein
MFNFAYTLTGPLGENEQENTAITTADGNKDTVFLQLNAGEPHEQEKKRMSVYVKGHLRSVVDFPKGLLKTSFGYSINNCNVPEMTGTLVTGKINLTQ